MTATALLAEDQNKDLLRLVTAGSVDDGKSTLIGRILYEASAIYEDQLSSIRDLSERRGLGENDLDLSLVTDGLKAEREQSITIDVAYRYFSTPRRKFIIADTPGHEQYTRNTATGASTANCMLILIDAQKGVVTQSRRHAFIGTLLGIPHITVAVNKMDLVGYSQDVFERISAEFTAFAARLEISDLVFVPVSALKGDNVVERSASMPWYRGSTLLNHLETLHVASDRNLIDLRFPVQHVYRPDASFRSYLGSVASGVIKAGDEVMALPSGRCTRVRKILGPDGDLNQAFPPLAVGILLEDEIDVGRGDMLVHTHNLPHVGRSFDAMIIWMAQEPMQPGKLYDIKHTTRMISGIVQTLRYSVNVDTLHRQDAHCLSLNEIGRCGLQLNRPIAYDPYRKNRQTGALIIVDRLTHNTVGAGMILDREPNELIPSSEEVAEVHPSDYVSRHRSLIMPEERARHLNQVPVTVWLTGLTGSGKSTLAYLLEKRLFDAGFSSYVLDGENVRLGLAKDLGFSADDRVENTRRCAEVASLLNDAGLIAICAILSPYRLARERARQLVRTERFLEIYLSAPLEVCRERDPHGLYALAGSGAIGNFSGVSAPYEKPLSADLDLATDSLSPDECVERILQLMRAKKFIS